MESTNIFSDMSQHVLAINKFWGSIIGTVLVAAVVGTATVEKNIYDGLANEVTDRKLLEEKVKPLIEANLPVRMATMEANIKETSLATQRIETQAGRTDEKIDKLLQVQYERRK